MTDPYRYLDHYCDDDFITNAYRQHKSPGYQKSGKLPSQESDLNFNEIDDLSWSEYVIYLHRQKAQKILQY